MATITDPIILDATGQAIANAIIALGNNANLKGEKGDKGDKGDDGYPFLIYKQYDDISEFTADDFPETGLMFMIMTAVPDNGYPVYRYDASKDPPYSFITYLQSEAIKGEKGDKGDAGDTYTPVIGTVTTLPMGSDATARIELDTANKKAKYSFGLPQSGVDDKIYRGSKADFAALSQEEQDKYTIRFFTDDGIATSNTLGVIKTDDRTTRVDADGTLHSVVKDLETNIAGIFSATAGSQVAKTVTFGTSMTEYYVVDATVEFGSVKHNFRFSTDDSGNTFEFEECQFTIISGTMNENGFKYSFMTDEYSGQVAANFNVYTLIDVDALKVRVAELEDTVTGLENTVTDLENTVAELDESDYEWKFLGWFGKSSLGGVDTVYVPKTATKVRFGISSSELGGENPDERDVRYYPFKEADRQLMADYSGSLFSVATHYKHAINAYLYFVGFEPSDMAGDTPSDTAAKHYILRMSPEESTVDSSDTDSIQVYAYVPKGTIIRYS